MSVVDRTHPDHAQRLPGSCSEKIRDIIAEKVETSIEPVAKEVEVDSDVLHYGLFPSDIGVVGTRLYVRDVVDAVVPELHIARSHGV